MRCILEDNNLEKTDGMKKEFEWWESNPGEKGKGERGGTEYTPDTYFIGGCSIALILERGDGRCPESGDAGSLPRNEPLDLLSKIYRYARVWKRIAFLKYILFNIKNI